MPRIGNDWGACDPSEPRNRRTRASILVEHDGVRILVDTSPDMRAQLLDAGVGTVDAIIWTHDHADHCFGIDDVRQIFHARGEPVPGYARAQALAGLRERFCYVFSGRHGYPSIIDATVLPDVLEVGPIKVRVVDQPHAAITSAGLRFEAGGTAIGYATDFNAMTAEMQVLYADLDVWIVDALRRRPHPSHPTLNQALAWIDLVRPRQSALIHMDQSMDYRALAVALPAGVEPGYDGLEYCL